MHQNEKIFVTGHRGMVGSAIMRILHDRGCANLLTTERNVLDLRQQAPVLAYFERIRPDVVIMAAARIGGIAANRSAPADFLFENVAIQNNLFQACVK